MIEIEFFFDYSTEQVWELANDCRLLMALATALKAYFKD